MPSIHFCKIPRRKPNSMISNVMNICVLNDTFLLGFLICSKYALIFVTSTSDCLSNCFFYIIIWLRYIQEQSRQKGLPGLQLFYRRLSQDRRFCLFFCCFKAVEERGGGAFSNFLALHAGGKLLAGHGFVLHQVVHNFHELVPVGVQDLGALLVSPVDE